MEVEGWFLALLAIHGIKSWVWEGHLGTSMQQEEEVAPHKQWRWEATQKKLRLEEKDGHPVERSREVRTRLSPLRLTAWSPGPSMVRIHGPEASRDS